MASDPDPVHNLSQRILERNSGEHVFTIRVAEVQLIWMKRAMRMLLAIEKQMEIYLPEELLKSHDDINWLCGKFEELQDKFGFDSLGEADA